ncbi:hypothetical protein [Streptomyces chartreusis]|uniref:hypothetical protein n=1 Tax=Streptomyces chartreusis TaxID=1969 RepID=UPI0037FADB5D
MRASRLLITGFRGWESLDLRPKDHVLLAGVPRAGRSDIVAALARVLDPDASRGAAITDLFHRARVGSDEGEEASVADGEQTGGVVSAAVQYAEVEVTLTDFDADVQQLVDGFLEPLDPLGCASQDVDAPADAPWCVRLAYRLTYDSEAESLESLVYFPARSNPAVGQFARVPGATRRALPVLVLDAGVPLQLRAGGNLRRILETRDPKAAAAAFDALRSAVADAVTRLSADPAVMEAVNAVLAVGGSGARLGDRSVTAAEVGFLAEDGSVAALLRSLRAALDLDGAGLLALTSHGSTASAVLSVAEAMLLASVPGAIVLVDDFGDHLDTAAAEHLAAVLRSQSGQLWMSTRRPEAARAFEPTELVRLVRHGGTRTHHQLVPPTDRKALTAMRQLHTQLLTALTAPAVAITEGPHDVAVLTTVDRRYPPSQLPLSAYGVRLVAAGTGNDGGIDQIPRVAALARQLGFRVLAVVDRDKETAQSIGQLEKVKATCDGVVRLPAGAIEQAMLTGVSLEAIAAASTALTAYGIPDPVSGRLDEKAVMDLCKVIHKQGLHEPLLGALYAETGVHPPVIAAALNLVAVMADAAYSGQQQLDLVEVPRPQAGS